MRWTPIFVAAALCFIAPAPGIGAGNDGTVSGQIQVLKDGKPIDKHGNVVVYLSGGPRSRSDKKHVIKQKDLQFSPRISVVVKGTTVEFPNEDKIYHNVFSTSRPARFDLGLYRSGSSKSVEFKREGVVDVFCNIHPEMSSRVLVVPSPLFTTTDAAGKFRIDGVPPGEYQVIAWHPNGAESKTTLKVEAGRTASMSTTVDEGSPAKPHLRKDGTPYGRYE